MFPGPLTVTEGHSLAARVSIRVPSISGFTLYWRLEAGGSAAWPADYRLYDAAGNELVPSATPFASWIPAPGPPSYQPVFNYDIVIRAQADNLVEPGPAESFRLVLEQDPKAVDGDPATVPDYNISHPCGPLYPYDPAICTVSIVDDPPQVSLSKVSDGSEDLLDPAHPELGAKPVRLAVTRSDNGDTSKPLIVKYQAGGINPDPASAADYSAGGTVTIPAGELSADLDIVPVDDTAIEAAWENLRVTLLADAAYVFGPPGTPAPFADGRIQDNDFRIVSVGVSFDSQGVKRDTGTQELYEFPQWLDGNGDGDAADTGERHFPLSYCRSTPAVGGTPAVDRFVTATSGFRIEGNPTSSVYTIQGTGTGPGGGVFQGTAALVSFPDGTWGLTASVQSNAKLGETIDKGTLAIAWKIISPKNPAKPVDYGPSTNTTYVTGAAATDQFETVLSISCEAKGKKPDGNAGADDKAIVDAIWAKFASKSVARVNDPQTPMRYWGPVSTQTPIYTTAELLKHGDGRCNAWSALMRDAVRVAGVKIRQAPGDSGFMMLTVRPNGWLPPDEGDNGARIVVAIRDAQGGQASTDTFLDHEVVVFGDTTYDPSYGARRSGNGTPVLASILWEDDFLKQEIEAPNGPHDNTEGAIDLVYSYNPQTAQ